MACPYTTYYVNQAQRGSGISQYYAGSPYQKGYGIGSIFAGLFRSAIPFLRPALSVVGREALHAGVNVLSNTLTHHTPLKEALRNQWQASASSLAEKAKQGVRQMVGSGAGIRKRRRAAPRQSTRRKRTVRTSRRRAPPKRKTKARRKTPKKKGKVRRKARKAIRKRKRPSFVKNDIFA